MRLLKLFAPGYVGALFGMYANAVTSGWEPVALLIALFVAGMWVFSWATEPRYRPPTPRFHVHRPADADSGD